MMPPHPRFLLIVAAAALLEFPPRGWTDTVATDPVGFITIALPADSDTFVSVPLKRPQEYAGLVSSLGTNPATPADLTLNTITVAGTTGWTNTTFNYVAGTQPKHYYAFIASGTKEGSFYTIVSNTPSTITLDLAGDNISPAVANGTKIQIIPYDTFGSIFPAGAGIVASPDDSTLRRQTEIFIPDQSSTGVDLPPSKSYYYLASSGWRKSGTTNAFFDDDILYPDSFVIVRMKAGQAGSLTVMGGVQMNTLQTPLNLLAANSSQDNPVAVPIPATLTLRQTQLFESGAFAGSASHATLLRKDQLFVWDNTVIGHDKPPTKSYYYYTGTNPGWRLSGDITTVRDDLDTVISPTTAVIVRKKSNGTVGSTFWKVKPPYVP